MIPVTSHAREPGHDQCRPQIDAPGHDSQLLCAEAQEEIAKPRRSQTAAHGASLRRSTSARSPRGRTPSHGPRNNSGTGTGSGSDSGSGRRYDAQGSALRACPELARGVVGGQHHQGLRLLTARWDLKPSRPNVQLETVQPEMPSGEQISPLPVEVTRFAAEIKEGDHFTVGPRAQEPFRTFRS